MWFFPVLLANARIVLIIQLVQGVRLSFWFFGVFRNAGGPGDQGSGATIAEEAA
jgi:hypothetical protein